MLGRNDFVLVKDCILEMQSEYSVSRNVGRQVQPDCSRLLEVIVKGAYLD